MGMRTKLFFTISFSLMLNIVAWAQFPGPAGTPGSTAMYKDSSAFVAWATGCEVVRGYINIAQPNLGLVSSGAPDMATGKSGENGVVSLGDGGYAILTFERPIKNGPGFDFAVFENAFSDMFLELAFVEVSSDGVNFFRFPATSLTDIDEQIGPFDQKGDATKLNNLAGKYRLFYGTPFDLEELAEVDGLDINNITHVKVIDVVGSIDPQWGTMDALGNMINDPYPTEFPTGGFDLDAVGVIHQSEQVALKNYDFKMDFKIFPNPLSSGQELFIQPNATYDVKIYDLQGNLLQSWNNVNAINITQRSGIYIAEITSNDFVVRKKLVVR